jgi:hypothetical protein
VGEVDGLRLCRQILPDDVNLAPAAPANIGSGDHARLVLCIIFAVGGVDRALEGGDAAVYSEGRVLYN